MFVSSKNPYDPGATVGGAETAMRQIADGLSKLGHDVTYFCLGGSTEASRRATSSGVKLIFFPATLNRLPLLWISPAVFAVLFWVGAIRRIQATYAFYELFGIVTSYLLGKWRPSMKVVLRIAGLSWKDAVSQPGWRRRVFRVAFKRADSLNYIHEDLIPMTVAIGHKVGIDVRDKTFFIGDIGVPVGELRGKKTQQREHSTPKAFVVLVPSRFSSYQKRQDLIIEAVKLIPPEILIEVRFVGDGVEQEAMKQLAKKLLNPNRYSFLGFLPQTELWDEMRHADVVALATEYEGLGKTVLEAMAIGTPSVVSDVPTLNGYIKDGRNGFLVQNYPEAWADVLREIIANPGELAKVAHSAQRFVTAHYSPSSNITIFADNLT